MRIKMLASLVGPEYDLQPGQETDRFSKKQAARLIEAGIAVPVEEKPETATAKRPAAETR